MPDLSVLERELKKLDEKRRAEIENEHFNRMHENYERLVYAPVDVVTEEKPATPAEPAQAPAEPAAPSKSTYQRSIEDYVRYEARESRGSALFEGVEYRDIAWGRTASVQETSVHATATAVEPSDEDALPTRRTMDTLRRGMHASVGEAEAVQAGFFASLTPRLKAAFVAVAVAIVVAIVLVFVNAGIIRSLDGRISLRESEIERLEQESAEILSDIEAISDPENIGAWAKAHGMTQS